MNKLNCTISTNLRQNSKEFFLVVCPPWDTTKCRYVLFQRLIIYKINSVSRKATYLIILGGHDDYLIIRVYLLSNVYNLKHEPPFLVVRERYQKKGTSVHFSYYISSIIQNILS